MPKRSRKPVRRRRAPSGLVAVDPQDPRSVLAFLIAFAQVDLDAATAEELAAAHVGVFAIVERDNPPGWAAAHPQVEVRVLRELQRRTAALLDDVVAQAPISLQAGDLVLSIWTITEGTTVRVVLRGRDDHRLLYHLVRVLEDVGTEKVRRCPATRRRKGQPDEPCGRMFLQRTTGSYCSTRCEKRMTTRRNRGE